MAITLEEATEMFEKMVEQEKGYTVDQVWETRDPVFGPIFTMIAIDSEEEQVFPGIKLKSIRKEDGALVDYRIPCPV